MLEYDRPVVDVKFEFKFANTKKTTCRMLKTALKTPLKPQRKKRTGSNSNASKFVKKLNLEVMPNVKRLAARLEPEDPHHLTSASDCGKLTN